MRILGSFFPTFVIAIVANFSYFGCGFEKIKQSTFDSIVLALQRDIEFMYKRPDQMNIDALLGLNFAQVHVPAALRNENSVLLKARNRWILRDGMKLCSVVKNDLEQISKTSPFEPMIHPDIWNRTIIWRDNELGGKPLPSKGLTRVEAELLIHQGSPGEPESSRCLVDLLSQYGTGSCGVSKKCAEMLVRKDYPRGYPLTHRLLYVQLAMALGCEERSHAVFAGLVKNYCTAILQDLVDLEFMNFPAPSIDLAMEQIFLCGTEGFLEFADEHFAKLIVSWPNSHGCFSATGFYGGKNRRDKRSTTFMDHGCDNHASGVAAASLSMLIRSAVENDVPQFF